MRRRHVGYVSLTSLLEVMLIGLVCVGVLGAMPLILKSGARGLSSASGPSAIEPLSHLCMTSKGKEIWVQRGASEIVSVDLETGGTESIYSRGSRPIRDWSVSRDSSTYLLCSGDLEVLVYRNHELIVSEQLSGNSSLMALLSADGTTAIRISGGKEVRCWDLSQDEPVESDFMLRELAIKFTLNSTGSKLFASTPDGAIDVYDLKTGTLAMTIAESESLARPVVSEDGRWLVIVGRQAVSLYDMFSNQIAWTIQTTERDGFHSAAISSNGQWVATTRFGSGIEILDGLSGECRYQFSSESLMHRVIFASSNDMLYSGATDGAIRTWSLSTGRETNRLALSGSARKDVN